MELLVRPLAHSDGVRLISWIGTARDLLIWGGPYFDFPLAISEIEALIDQHTGDSPKRECWAVTNEASNLIGSFQISYNHRTGQADLGRVIIDPAYRGRGLGLKLISLAIDLAFSRIEVHRLELRVYDFNTAALSTYRRAGFTVEGSRRESVRFEDEYWSTVIMGLLRSELGPAT